MEKNYISTREQFLALKEEQKRLTSFIKEGNAQYKKDLQEYRDGLRVTPPEWREAEKLEWYYRKPKVTENEFADSYSKRYAEWFHSGKHFYPNNVREFNIVYGMVRGKSYKQIEIKVKKDNFPHLFEIKKIIKDYGLNEDDFFINGELK